MDERTIHINDTGQLPHPPLAARSCRELHRIAPLGHVAGAAPALRDATECALPLNTTPTLALLAGDIRRMPPGVTWRILNSTFRCTGNDTHPLPSAAAASSDDTSKARFATAMVAAMAALVAGAYWMVNRNGAWAAGNRGTGLPSGHGGMDGSTGW